jgi:arylsulfatase A-like enzyme
MPKPNLLFLITDQQRADTTESGGPCQMPHLARLAATGVHPQSHLLPGSGQPDDRTAAPQPRHG